MAAIEIEIPVVEAIEASTDLAGDTSAAQQILEVESAIRDITVIPPCTVCIVSSQLGRRT